MDGGGNSGLVTAGLHKLQDGHLRGGVLHRDPVRAQLASTIGERRDTRFIEALSSLLASDKPGLRRTGLEAMRATGSPSAFPFLMAATGDADGRVVSTAVGGLEALGDPRARARFLGLRKAG